ncbi:MULTISPECIES: hypothetical protein [unclassified Leptolyngbya]|uniref:hypothetical protein n=1 Tax=unclassified Leptolyngbya TaxID=2650499 RepID=UPI0016884D76|nr:MULTISPECIES: hypothetical protein [unclassified Leptolyngbya]MBD1910338.1 hypothetical protein [Leptolyngbya sp. FACHB-8]MBD2154859.1 hypothetical protein [Leptolyngbya sp. FACHB-16]
MDKIQRYRVFCTLSFGDIYGQIVVWLVVIFLSLASAMALLGSSRPIYALATVGLILVLSLPFLLFAFVTTLLNHIEFKTVDPADEKRTTSRSSNSGQRPAQLAS